MSKKQTNKQTYKQTNKQKAKIKQTKQADRLERRGGGAGGWRANLSCRQQTHRQIDRHATGRQADRQTDRQRNGQARDRQIDRPRGRQEGGKLEKYKSIKRR